MRTYIKIGAIALMLLVFLSLIVIGCTTGISGDSGGNTTSSPSPTSSPTIPNPTTSPTQTPTSTPTDTPTIIPSPDPSDSPTIEPTIPGPNPAPSPSCTVSPSPSPSPTPAPITWQKCLGGTSHEEACSIKQTSDGGYIIAGYAYSVDGDVIGIHGSEDIWIVKIDSLGNIIWQKCYGGTKSDSPHEILQTSDGGYIVAGFTESDDGDITGKIGGNSNQDYWILKINSTGQIEWEKCFGGTNHDHATSIQQTSDGGYVIAGWTYSIDGDVSGNHSTNADIWIVKIDNLGNIIWQKCLGGTSLDIAHCIQQTLDGGYIVTGYTRSNDGDVSGNHSTAADIWIVKLDTNGIILWQKCLGGTKEDIAYKIQETSDNGYIVIGYTESNDGDVSGNHSLNKTDCWVIKLDHLGNVTWQKCLGGTNSDYGRSIQQISGGGYIIAGSTNSNDGDVTNKIGDNSYNDYWIVKLNSSGDIIWQKCYGGSGDDIARCIRQTSDGGYVVAGYTRSDDGDVFGNHSTKQDYWIIKLDSNGNL